MWIEAFDNMNPTDRTIEALKTVQSRVLSDLHTKFFGEIAEADPDIRFYDDCIRRAVSDENYDLLEKKVKKDLARSNGVVIYGPGDAA